MMSIVDNSVYWQHPVNAYAGDMIFFKNLSRDKKKIYRRAYELDLTEWHWTAAQILLDVHGLDTALGYLEKCAKKKQGTLFT